MGVHFVYRCHYAGPSEKHIRHFPDEETVLDFFRGVWRPIADREEADQYAEELLGFHVHSFGGLFVEIADRALPRRRTRRSWRTPCTGRGTSTSCTAPSTPWRS